MVTEPSAPTAPDWPGQRLGLPESGPRSVGRLGRRIGAITIDWMIAVVISAAFFSYQPLVTLAIFVGLQVLMTVVVAASQYLAWKDVFGEAPAGAEPPPPRETIAAL